MKKILVPVDFSKESKYATDFAIQLGERNGYKINVIHVVEYPVGTIVDPVGVGVSPAYDPDFVSLLKENGKSRMEDFFDDFDNEIDIDASVEVGNPYNSIVDSINTEGYDLVIMGTKGTSGLSEFIIGSNTEKIVRAALCPVIAVKGKVNASAIKNIVFATTTIDLSEDMMQHVKQLQAMFDAKLHMVRVNTPGDFERDSVVKAALKKIVDRYMLTNCTINIYSDVYEDDGIRTFAEEVNADLIAMGTHGRRGLGHLIYGSLAEDLVNHEDRPIWTYHIKK